MKRTDAEMNDADAKIVDGVTRPHNVAWKSVQARDIEAVHDDTLRAIQCAYIAPCGFSLTRDTSCVGFTKRNAISSHTSVTSM